ncbi:MAG: transglycosylase domain-containing protein [Clostridia bacterium]|nr:transglycosylase domain-containing protein [Clostridia bacterium]
MRKNGNSEKNSSSTQGKLLNKNRQSEPLLKLTVRRASRPFALDIIFSTLKLLLVAVVICGFCGVGLVFGVVKAYVDTSPVWDVSQLTKSDRTSYLYDMYGNEITNLTAIEYRDWVDIEDIPDMLKNAFIAVEDVRFYKHQGVDFKRLFSAALEILGSSNSSGGSTITQQLIKNKILTSERTYRRKIQEAYLALQLESILEKDDILEAYLNDIYLGESNYGVSAAAKDYFGKELNQLTIRECAMLAGLTQNPYRYNPRKNMYQRTETSFDLTNERTDLVLERMYENGLISLEQYTSALTETVTIVQYSETSQMYDMAYFVEYAVYDVITHWMEQDGVADTTANRSIYENRLRTGGYKIYTTVDPEIQNTVQDSLSTWDAYPELADSNASVLTETISDGVVIETVEPQSAAVVIDHSTGELRAVIGGRNEPTIRKGLNRAYQSYTEVGSSIKPLAVYGPALDLGASPATVVVNAEGAIDGWGGENGYPSGGLTSRNYGVSTIRDGLIKSLNVVAARTLFEYVTPSVSVEYLNRLGLADAQINEDGPGLALGTSGITPIQMAAAYAAIANNGYYLEPLSFIRVEDSEGNVILDADIIRGSARRVFTRSSTAYFLIDILTEAVESGTGTNAQIEGYQVAGKTGTNSDYASVYFAGMTCEYTAVVWIGHDQPSNKLVTGASGGDYAAPLWQDFMSKIMEGVESVPISSETPTSLGLVERAVCPVSGMLATDACAAYQAQGSKFSIITDWFDYQSVPTSYCDMHCTLDICQNTNCIAGEHCAQSSVVQTTFVLIRPDSQFYKLTDDVLTRIFGDTYRRTDKSIDAFIAEFPVCTEASSLEALLVQRDELILEVRGYIETTAALTEADIQSLQTAIAGLEASTVYSDMLVQYTALQQLYDTIKERYPPADNGQLE